MKTTTTYPFLRSTSPRTSGPGLGAGRRRAPWKLLAVLGAALVCSLPTLRASDPVGVYALIDKVVLEPAEGPPERIQVYGVFSLAAAPRGDAYKPPQNGFLYYQLPEAKADAAAIEWKDLQSMAGTGEVIGFGNRRLDNGKVRHPKTDLARPDVYPMGWGLVRIRNRSANYPPIRDLLAFKEKADAKKKKGDEEKKPKD